LVRTPLRYPESLLGAVAEAAEFLARDLLDLGDVLVVRADS